MFKVECESCKSPFQIDERRVPPAGLKMRCPKCGHSFLVTTPGTDLPEAKPAAPARPAAAAPPTAPPVAPARPQAAAAPPAPPIAPPAAPKIEGPKPKNPLKSTMVGVGGGDAGFKPLTPAIVSKAPALPL